MKRKVGRPTKFKHKFCKMVIEHMSKGKSFESFGKICGYPPSQMYKWVAAKKEFRDAVEMAFVECLDFWETKGINGIENKHIRDKLTGKTISITLNASHWAFNMKNRFRRFGWSDQFETLQTEKDELPYKRPESMPKDYK